MQSVTVEGYLAADPSVLTSAGDGRRRASFRVLETTRFRRADGQRGERTTGFNCVSFSEPTVDNYLAPFARKGSRVIVRGRVENDTWTGKDGTEHYDLKLIVDDVRLKGRRDGEGGGRMKPGIDREGDGPATPAAIDDEIPF